MNERKAMKYVGVLAVAAVALLGFAGFAQADLDQFPLGTTQMVYRFKSEEVSAFQSLELDVTAHEDGQYTVRMEIEQSGEADEMTAGFGFMFGSTHVSSGSGGDVNYDSLAALIDQRSRLQEGQDYLLPSGGQFTNITGVTIAGVFCLEGVLDNPDEPDTRATVAFAISHPVYISPRIRSEELRDGVWVETFALELIDYTIPEGDG
jgi:hypothetical protein